MSNPRLLKRKNHWHLLDDSLPPTEGGTSMYADAIPVFTNFIDEEKRNCIINNNNNNNNLSLVSFDELETVVASSNYNDGLPMLDINMLEDIFLLQYVYLTLGGTYGVKYPDEDDSVMGYYPTEKEGIDAVKAYLNNKFFMVLVKDEYKTKYTISFASGKQLPYINPQGFVNILIVESN